ncbi:MAG TPA: Gmad2 immunoglobulin-like domain-containing protein [Candidatus Saccharimonadales bacterium]|nr:Gmad2 immunoglobulin-like domain-containing protein [Candidatus Saccharimonadales bacterium]
MNKKLKLGLSLAALLIIGLVTYLFFNSLNQTPSVGKENKITTITYLVSQEDTTKYCNGEDMNSADYQKTIITKESTTTLEANPTRIKVIKTILNAATTGMCNTVLGQLDITENNGIVYIPQIEDWAGISIAMCSCKPQVEVNLLQIPGITKVIWSATVNNFDDCVATGNPVMESYPRQCRYGDKTYTENIGNELEKVDLINLETPRPNEKISSPLTIKGQARGSWFFEASFPVFLTDWDGKIIAQGVATAKSDWMTTEFVSFEATLAFTTDENVYSDQGSLILKKDNPSGLSENDDALEVPVIIN